MKLTAHYKRAIAMLVCVLTFAQTSPALQIRIGENMNARVLSDDALQISGVLAAGSIIEIPDKYKVVRRGRIDPQLTLDNWLRRAGYSKRDIAHHAENSAQEFFYPVHIIRSAPGSRGRLNGKVRYMALRALEEYRGGLKVVKTSHVYRPNYDTAPLQPISSDSYADSESQGTCRDCLNAQTQAAEPPRGAASLGQIATNIEEVSNPQSYIEEAANGRFQGFPSAYALCQNFVSSRGGYGRYGQMVLKEISRYEAFSAPLRGMSNVCRNYNSFSQAQKRHFWVYAFAALAAGESSCDPNAMNKNAPHGHAAGLLQIEEREKLRLGRDRKYGGHFCAGGDPYDPAKNIRCGVRMMVDVLDDGLGPYNPHTGSQQYWAQFAYSGTRARRIIAGYRACGN